MRDLITTLTLRKQAVCRNQRYAAEPPRTPDAGLDRSTARL